MKIKCIVCDTELQDYGDYQPDGGTAFHSYGHYGSAVTDHMDGTVTSLAVCDSCMIIALQTGGALQTEGYPMDD
jgi:hypothetical protein